MVLLISVIPRCTGCPWARKTSEAVLSSSMRGFNFFHCSCLCWGLHGRHILVQSYPDSSYFLSAFTYLSNVAQSSEINIAVYTLPLCGGLVPLSFHVTVIRDSVKMCMGPKMDRDIKTQLNTHHVHTYVWACSFGESMVWLIIVCTYVHAINTH